jgi:hypothetical protein
MSRGPAYTVCQGAYDLRKLHARELITKSGPTTAVASADELDHPKKYDVMMYVMDVIAAIKNGIHRVRRRVTCLQFGVAAPGRCDGGNLALSSLQRRDDPGRGDAVLDTYDGAFDFAIETDLGLL